MTICISKKPFDVLGMGLYYILLWSWIPVLIITITLTITNNQIMFMIFNIIAMPSYLYSIAWLCDLNEKKHWIEWCKK